MSPDLSDIPIKLEYEMPPNSSRALWRNERGDFFVDMEIEFGRDLNPSERLIAIRHFIIGFEDLDAQHEYCPVYVQFFEPRILKMTFQVLDVSRTRSLLALTVQLRKKFPVIRIGNRTYETLSE